MAIPYQVRKYIEEHNDYTDLAHRTRKLHQLLGELHADALACPDLADTLEEAYTILDEFIKEEDKENEEWNEQ